MLQTILARAGLPALVKRQRERGESFGELAGTFGSFGELRGDRRCNRYIDTDSCFGIETSKFAGNVLFDQKSLHPTSDRMNRIYNGSTKGELGSLS